MAVETMEAGARAPQGNAGKPGLAFAGLAGGLLPSFVYVAGQLTQSFEDVPMPQLGYCLGVLLYGLIGAAVGIYFSDRTLRDAFKVGIAAPALVMTLANSVAQANAQDVVVPGPDAVTLTLRLDEAADTRARIDPVPYTLRDGASVVGVGALRPGESKSFPADGPVTLSVEIDGRERTTTVEPGNTLTIVGEETKSGFGDQLLWGLTGVPRAAVKGARIEMQGAPAAIERMR